MYGTDLSVTNIQVHVFIRVSIFVRVFTNVSTSMTLLVFGIAGNVDIVSSMTFVFGIAGKVDIVSSICMWCNRMFFRTGGKIVTISSTVFTRLINVFVTSKNVFSASKSFIFSS
uniref:Uncharacterized protein n=1 Tax=Cacopsylla melanoneura TaxID=428564 RepID=A0A8D8TM06_9HEMI